jgi:hypothetical protein
MVETENDKEDRLVLTLNKCLDYVYRLVALAKERQTNVEQVIYTDGDGNDAVALVYDYRIIKMTGATTFDRLAQDYYANPDLGPLIAYYNRTQNEHRLEAGVDIKIPVLEQAANTARGRIYATPEMQDNYGIDIAISDTGDFPVKDGDFATVGGPDNLAQAIGNRLTTAGNKRIRLGTYGIRLAIGDAVAVNSFLLSSIEQTVLGDPRIERVDDISFRGEGDALFVTITYTDINGHQDTRQEKI